MITNPTIYPVFHKAGSSELSEGGMTLLDYTAVEIMKALNSLPHGELMSRLDEDESIVESAYQQADQALEARMQYIKLAEENDADEKNSPEGAV